MTDASTSAIVVPLIFVIIALSVLLIGCCCIGLCCIAPLVKLFSILVVSLCSCFGLQASETFRRNGYQKTRSQSSRAYDNGYQGNEIAVTAPLYSEEDIIVTDAYFQSPLVAAHVIEEGDEQSVIFGQVHEINQESQSVDDVRFKDIWFTVLFTLNIITIVSLSLREGIAIYRTKGVDSTVENDISNFAYKAEPVILACLAFGAVATLCGALWLNILLNYSDHLIRGVMITNIVIAAFTSITFFLSGSIIFGILFALCTMFSYWYFISVQNRIPFATAVLSTAIKAVKQNLYGLLSTAYSLLLVQVIYIIIWSVSILGVAQFFQSFKTHNEDEESKKSSLQFFSYFLMAFSLYWAIEVIKNILQVTCSGVTATWFFQPERIAPVRGSLFRSLTTSFGSICFGSLLVAFVQTVRDFVHVIRNKVNANTRNRNIAQVVLLCILDQLLAWLEAAVRYFNRYAFCYVAAWGKSYIESGRAVMALFERRGWTTIINDDLIANVLSLSIIALSLFCAAIGYTFAFFFSSYFISCGITSPSTFLGLIGGALGAAVGHVLVSLLHSAVSTIFVCLAEDPMALQKNHPNEFEILCYTWQMIHPGTLHINTQYASEVSAPMLPVNANKV